MSFLHEPVTRSKSSVKHNLYRTQGCTAAKKSVCVSDVQCAEKPSKPQCWMEGKLLEGGDVKISCKSADGSDPIHYKWEMVRNQGKYVSKLPPLAMIGKSSNTL